MRRVALGFACGALGVLVFPSGALADVTAMEGTSFTKRVADTGSCTLASAAITWGDGTADSPGDPTDDGTGVQGTHKYAEEGSYNGSVHYTCNNFGGAFSATFTATVQDAPLTAAGRDSSGQAGQSLTAVVAHYDDANPDAAPAQFTAQIDWGDGTTSPGTTGIAVGGGFDVTGTHTYTTSGTFTVTTKITDTPDNTATTTATAQIGPGPLQARFTTVPAPPCGDQIFTFDASASSGGDSPIREYKWTIRYPNDPGYPTVVKKTSHSDLDYFVFSLKHRGAFRGNFSHAPPHLSPVNYAVYDYILESPPISVTLRITNYAGQAVERTKTVEFANPSVTQQVGYATGLGWTGAGYTEWLVSEGQRGACALTYADFFGDTATQGSVALAKLTTSPAVLIALTEIAFRAKCPNSVKDCLALADVTRAGAGARASSRATRRAAARSLGSATFVIPAGKSATVKVRLNARGRKLARAHKLRRVKLLLGSVGAKGKIVVTSRTVRLHTRRHK